MYNHSHRAGFTASHSTVLAGNANLMQEVWLPEKQYQTASLQSSATPQDKENPKMPQGRVQRGGEETCSCKCPFSWHCTTEDHPFILGRPLITLPQPKLPSAQYARGYLTNPPAASWTPPKPIHPPLQALCEPHTAQQGSWRRASSSWWGFSSHSPSPFL